MLLITQKKTKYIFCIVFVISFFSLSSFIKNKNKYYTHNFFPNSAGAGIGISHPDEIEHLVVCVGQILNGSQNKIRVYNTGDEDLIINLELQKTGVNFIPEENNFLLKKGISKEVTFSMNITDLAATAEGELYITGSLGEQPGNPIVASAKIDVLFTVLETRKITFHVKDSLSGILIPNVKVILYRKMDTNLYFEYSSQFSNNGNGFFLAPAGNYRLEAYLDGIFFGQKDFSVTSEDVEITIRGTSIYGGILIFILIFILIGLIFGILAYILFRRRKKEKEKPEAYQISDAFKDILKLLYILIIKKQTKKTIFYQSFSEKETDTRKIGNFIQSIIQHIQETFTNNPEGLNLREMKLGDNNLLVFDGNLIWLCFIIKDSFSQQTQTRIKEFGVEFESKYRDLIKSWGKNLLELSDIIEFLDKYLEISLLLPYKFKEYFITTIESKTIETILNAIKEIFEENDKEVIFIHEIIHHLQERSIITEDNLEQFLLSIKKLINFKILSVQIL